MAAAFSPLIGRDDELTHLTGLLGSARDGVSAVRVLCGEPGVGKTALLERIAGMASGFRVLRARGLQSEVDLPFGGLAQLLRPLMAAPSELNSVQLDVLETGLARGVHVEEAAVNAPGMPDRFAVAAAALTLLAVSAEQTPLLVLVDDAQWLDGASVSAVCFVAHRLLADRVVLLLSRRTGQGSPALDDLPEMLVEGLSVRAAADLLKTVGSDSVGPPRFEQFVAELNGNPLAILELPRLLSADQLSGLVPMTQPLPIGDALTEAYASSLAALSEKCRRAALIVSLLDEPDLRSVELALNAAGLETADLSDAEDSGLLDVGASEVTFRHPLVRSAVTYSAPPSWRRTAHAAVGSSLHASTDTKTKFLSVWHLAAATLGFDEKIASLLDEAAEQALQISGLAAAASAYERAAQLSPGQSDRYRRLVRGADAASLAGHLKKAGELLDESELLDVDDFDHALVGARTRIRLEFARANVEVAMRLARAAAEKLADLNPLDASQILIEGAAAAAFHGATEVALRYAERAVELSEADAVAKILAQAAQGSVLLIRGDSVIGLELISALVSLPTELLVSDPNSLQHVARIAFAVYCADEFSLADDLLAAVQQRAVAVGQLAVLPWCFAMNALIELRRGRCQSAVASAEKAYSLAKDMGQELEAANGLFPVAAAAAILGQEESCRSTAQLGLGLTGEYSNHSAEAGMYYALGFLELSLRRLDESISYFEKSRAICETCGLLEMGNWQWGPELAEAYVRNGDIVSAAAIVDMLDWHASRTGRPIVKAFAARCRGLISVDGFERHFEDALGWHRQS